jgi:nucleotide-binding universal stress UspA family protein
MAGKTFTHIMTLIDGGSPQSYRAAEAAIVLAKATGAKLTVLGVIDTVTLRDLLTYRILHTKEMADLEAEMVTSTRRHLDRVQNMARAEGLDCQAILLRGAVHNEVLNQQRHLAIDLVTLGAFTGSLTGRGLWAREYQKIIDTCPCPLLLVK